MKGHLLIAILAGALLSGNWMGAWAQSWPQKAFDITYEIATSGAPPTRQRHISDGRGHIRMETTTPQGTVVSLLDYPSRAMWTLMEAQKMAMKVPFDPSAAEGVRDSASAKQYRATPLGPKVVDGHPCHGWRYTTAGTTTDAWVGDDIDNLVYSASSGPHGQSTMRLKSYSAAAPSPSLFTVPSNYKIMSIPTLGGSGFPVGAAPAGGFQGGGSFPGGSFPGGTYPPQ